MKRLSKATIKVGKWKGHKAIITQPKIENSKQLGVLVDGHYVESFKRNELIVHRAKK